MSLAQKVERPQVAAVDPSPAEGQTPRIAVPVDFRDITRRPSIAVVPLALASTTVLAPPEVPAAPKRTTDLAMELLNEVSQAMPLLLGRCADLEAELAATLENAKTELDTANEVAHEWQQIAATLKLQVDGLEKGLRIMKQRAEAAELKASSLRDETERSQHAAAEAECLSSLFQEKVIASFGEKSPIHPVLEAIRAKTASLLA